MWLCFSGARQILCVIPAKAGIHHAGITTIAEEVEGPAFQPCRTMDADRHQHDTVGGMLFLPNTEIVMFLK